VGQGVVLHALANLAIVALGYGVHVVTGRRLEPAAYGRFVVVLSVLLWVQYLLGSLLVPGLAKAVSEDHRRLGAALDVAGRWGAGAALLAAGVFLAAAPALGAAFGDPALVGLLVLAAAQVPLVFAVGLGQALLNAMGRYGSASAVAVVHAAARAAAVCGLVLLGLGAEGAVAGVVAASGAASAVAIGWIRRRRRELPAVAYPRMARRTLAWSAAAVPATFARTTLQSTDLWLVKAMLPEAALAGLYGMAYTVSRLPAFVLLAFGSATFPRVSAALSAGRAGEARAVAAQAVRALTIALVPACALITGSAGEVMALLFGPARAGGAAVLALLTGAMGLYAYQSLLLSLLAAADRPFVRMASVLALVPLNVAACAVLIGRWSIEGAAVASLATFAVGAAGAGALACRELGGVIAARTLTRCLAAGVAVHFAGRYWPADGAMLLVKLPALGAAYVAALTAMRELGREDLARLRHAVLGGRGRGGR